jgi:hypothetical protein
MIDDFESPTLIRTRVAFSARTTSAGTANNFLGFGIYVASGDEDDITVPTLLWEVIADGQSDWVYRHVAVEVAGNAAGAVIHSNGGADTTVESKAKRKIPRGAGILGVFSTDRVGAGTDSLFNATADVRVLIISG